MILHKIWLQEDKLRYNIFLLLQGGKEFMTNLQNIW